MAVSTRFFKLVHNCVEVDFTRYEYSLIDIDNDIVYSAHDYTLLESLIAGFDCAYESYFVFDDYGNIVRSKN